MNTSRLFDMINSLSDKQMRWTRELISIPTVNPYSGDQEPAGERAGQEWIEARMRELGAKTRRIPVPQDIYAWAGLLGPRDREWDGRENIVGEWVFGDGNGPTIVLNSHMDTVGVNDWDGDPFEAQLKEGRLSGRGASDSKGNLALGLIALETLMRTTDKLRGRALFESVVDEECNGGGAGTLACCRAGITGDAAIVLDGSAGRPYFRSNGIVTPRITINAEAGHSAAASGAGALDLALAVHSAFTAFELDHRSRYPECRCSIGVFRAGTHPSVVPGKAEIVANIFYPFEEAAACERATGFFDGRRIRKRFEESVAGATESKCAGRTNTEVNVEWLKDLYPYRCDPDDALFLHAREAMSEVRADWGDIDLQPAWSDATHLARQLNKPVLGMGFGTPGQAHATPEYAEIDYLYQGTASVALLLQKLLDPKTGYRSM